MMERLLMAKQLDIIDYHDPIVSPDFLEEYEIADQKSEFYQQARSLIDEFPGFIGR